MSKISPDELLKKIKQDEDQQGKGRLKIFFGYAAGVGKTYAMLKAAHDAKEAGFDVVAGYIEPHTRPQTMELLDGLETLSPLCVEYKGIQLKEFDLDGAIARKPELLLVDELAHTNAAPCRHEKRYQDIGELLNAGIDVYTTVNVQHIESLKDMVASITGVQVHERIPDKVFDEADQVELVDIEPEELIWRLQEGKIYKRNQVEKALNHFFTIENLTALREIALRRCADQVNKVAERSRQDMRGEYYREEHILVCLSSSPSNAKIIRTAARLANAFKGRMTAVYVETPRFKFMSEEDKKRLKENIHLAEQLGANIETVYGEDVAYQIAEYVRISGASKVVVGRSNTRRRYGFFTNPFTERLTEHAPNLDIYIIPDQGGSPHNVRYLRQPRKKLRLSEILKAVLTMVIATLIGGIFGRAGFSEANIITIYILGVLVAALLTSDRIYSVIISIVSVLLFNFFFADPKYTFTAYASGYPVTFVIMFLAAFLTSTLGITIQRQAAQAAGTAYRTKILLDTNQMIAHEKSAEGIINVTARQLVKLLHLPIVFYPSGPKGLSEPLKFEDNEEVIDFSKYTTENEQAVAIWVYKNNKRAGATTDTLGNAKCLYLAVRGAEGVYGVVGIAVGEKGLETFENSLLLSILGDCGLALEKDLYAKKRVEAAAQAKNEQMRANLLRSISHDLRTPLTSISGNAGVLRTSSDKLDEEKKQQLYSDIYEDSIWLINLVENLLAVTKIEDGTMNLHLQAELLEEVVDEAVHRLNRYSDKHKFVIRHEDEFVLAKMDVHLIIQVIINLVDNAIKYTPSDSTITITTRKQNGMAIVEVADNGEGLSDESKSRIFEMFYTANNGTGDSRRSLGLGLALCKSIINAHGGTISVHDYKPHGTIFRFTLTAEEAILNEPGTKFDERAILNEPGTNSDEGGNPI